MDSDRLILGIASVFAGITVLLVILAFVKQLFLLVVAVPFAATTYFMWFQATGRLESRVRARPFESRARRESEAGPRGGAGPSFGRSRSGGRAATTTRTSVTRSEAFRTLGVSPGASRAEIRSAYRAKVKDVHPDTETGSEEAFKRVNRAYETLTK